jgi:alkylation response protein AidB-like acyl-CoA dehydrogenase
MQDRELKMLEKAASEFAKKTLAADREENDKFPCGPFFSEVLDKALAFDFFHMVLPESAGGIGKGIRALSVILSAISEEDSSLAGIIFTTSAAIELMVAAGCQDRLAGLFSDREIRNVLMAMPVFCHPAETVTLPEAVISGDEAHISGNLDYLTLGGIASKAVVPATIAGMPSFSYFLVDLEQPAVKKSLPVLSLGLRSCPSTDMTFNRAKASLLGEPGKGHEYFGVMADRMHAASSAMSLGVMKGSFREALEYCRKRKQGGQEIIHWSELKMILSNMAIHLKVAEMLVTRACQAVKSREKGWETTSRASALHVQSLACDLTTDGIQALGGVGYMKDFGQEKRFRDAKQIQSFLGIAPVKRIRYLDAMIH